MITLPVGEFKARFSDILRRVEQGGEFVISYGKRHRKVAALIPYEKLKRRRGSRTLGVLKGKARFAVSQSFKMSPEEFLGA